MTTLKTSLLAMTLLAAIGCGASSEKSDGGGDGGLNCGDPTLAIDPTAVIDDMEAPDSVTKMGGGSWWAGGDDAAKAAGASIVPDGSVTAEKIAGGRCGSMYAAHVTGQGFSVWAVMNVSFGWGSLDGGPEQLLPYDASFRTGITFWARIGDTSSANVRLAITDAYSNDVGGICDKTIPNGPTSCYDHFGVNLTLDTNWKQFKVPFGGLTQLMFGIPRAKLDTTRLYSIDFQLPLGTVFDLWVDDMSFY